MRRKITEETWDQIDTAIASGIGAREIARNMQIPEGTVLSHIKRKGLTEQIQEAKKLAPKQSNAITPLQSATITMQQRGEAYAERMAGVSGKVLPHLESMQPADILESARNIEMIDRVGRRTFGMDDRPSGGGPINIAILANQAAIQVSPAP